MPAGDGTGPMGFGPMTGRRAGYCAGYAMPGYANPWMGRGWFGHGRGWRHRYWATGLPGWARPNYGWPVYGTQPLPSESELTPKTEMDMLKRESEFLKSQLDDIQSRISALEKTEAQGNE